MTTNQAQTDLDRHAVFAESARLTAEAHALWKRAAELKSQFRIDLHITQDPGVSDSFAVDLEIFGEMHSLGIARTAEEACQKALYLIQGFRPPHPLPPFGTRLDGTETGLYTAADSLSRSPEIQGQKS